jgi:hypothetical protein
MTFQLPALAKGNCFTVVVGPLMALAKDQVSRCCLQHCQFGCFCAPAADKSGPLDTSDLTILHINMCSTALLPKQLQNAAAMS